MAERDEYQLWQLSHQLSNKPDWIGSPTASCRTAEQLQRPLSGLGCSTEECLFRSIGTVAEIFHPETSNSDKVNGGKTSVLWHVLLYHGPSFSDPGKVRLVSFDVFWLQSPQSLNQILSAKAQLTQYKTSCCWSRQRKARNKHQHAKLHLNYQLYVFTFRSNGLKFVMFKDKVSKDLCHLQIRWVSCSGLILLKNIKLYLFTLIYPARVVLNMSHGQARTLGVMTENTSSIRQSDLDLWPPCTKSQQRFLCCVSQSILTDWWENRSNNNKKNSPWQVFPSSFNLRPGGHLQ